MHALNLTNLNIFLHLFAAVTWIGAGIFMNVVLNPSLRSIEPIEAGKLMSSVLKRMTIISWGSAFLLVTTGFIGIPSQMLFNFNTTYATVISIKLGLVMIVLVNTSLITFIFTPRVIKSSGNAGEGPADVVIKSQNNLRLLSQLNTIIGVIIMLLVSII